MSRESGITPILLTAPSSHKKGTEPEYLADRWLNDLSELIPLHQQYANAVRELASGERVILVDLYAEFERLPETEQIALFEQDGIHLSEAGSRKVAEMLYAAFVENDVLDQLINEE